MRIRFLPFVATGSLALALASNAAAQSTIKRPGDHPAYHVELEPHALLGVLDPPGFGAGTGVGVGGRASVVLLQNGFLRRLNDSIALGFGLDYLRYDGFQGPRGECEEFTSGPSGTRICVRASSSVDHVDYFYAPVVMQWNFWLHRRWSVFGEPGLALYVQDGDVSFDPLVFYSGGRFHASERVSVTLRIGYPTFSLGASFLL